VLIVYAVDATAARLMRRAPRDARLGARRLSRRCADGVKSSFAPTRNAAPMQSLQPSLTPIRFA